VEAGGFDKVALLLSQSADFGRWKEVASGLVVQYPSTACGSQLLMLYSSYSLYSQACINLAWQ
jgi:hypothetical protein